MTYLDSAILVKIYTEEPDSEHWRRVVGNRNDLTSSILAVPEVKSALRQKTQLKLLRASVAEQIWKEFRRAVERGIIRSFPLGSDVVEESVQILDALSHKISLRTLDALHLATAKLLKCSALATTDQRMLSGARALSIPLL